MINIPSEENLMKLSKDELIQIANDLEMAIKRVQEISAKKPGSNELKDILRRFGFDVGPYPHGGAETQYIATYFNLLTEFLEGVVEMVSSSKKDEQEWLKDVFYNARHDHVRGVLYFPDYKW